MPSKKPSSSDKVLAIDLKKQGVLVLGMHRSGTSAITRVLNLLGCALPPEIIGAADGNEQGHWESISAVNLNDEILESAGSNWKDWGPINDDWRQSGLRVEKLELASRIVREHAELGPLFALKDPRMCRLADIWLEAMDAVSVEPRVILMLRHPLEVAASLDRRDLMAPGYGQLLWLRHVLDAEYFSRGRRRVVCQYDQLLLNWHATVEQVKQALGIALPRNAPAAHAEVGEFLSRHHRHHEFPSAAVLNDVGQSEWLRSTFAIMSNWSVSGERASDFAVLDRIRTEFSHAYGAFAHLLLPQEFTGDFGAARLQTHNLEEQLAEAKRVNDAIESSLREAELQLAAAGMREDELNAQAAQLGASEAQMASQIEAATANVQQREAEIEALKSEVVRLGQELDIARSQSERVDEVKAELTLQIGSREAQIRELEADADKLRAELAQAFNAHATVERQLATALTELSGLKEQCGEIRGQLSAAQSALTQRQEELAQNWSQLLASEKAVSAAETLAAVERERRQELERRARSAEAEMAIMREHLVRIEAVPVPLAPPHQLFDEVAQLTKLLQDRESALADATSARSKLEQELAEKSSERDGLVARLRDEEGARKSAQVACSEAESKLASRFNETARLTSIVSETVNQNAKLSGDVEWLRSMAQQAERFPRWWLFLPEKSRRRREHKRYARAGLFDAGAYLEMYPDVADFGMDPVLHYLRHGLVEGRQRPQ